MSKVEVDTGQIQAQPTIEGQQDICDKNADSDQRSRKKHHSVVVGFRRPICFRLIATRMIHICKELGLLILIAFTYAALTNE